MTIKGHGVQRLSPNRPFSGIGLRGMGPFKNDVTRGEEGGGSDKLVTNGDKGGEGATGKW